MISDKLIVLFVIIQVAKTVETRGVQPVRIDILPNTTICGLSSRFDRFPWMALIEHERPNGKRVFFCGGVLISKRYVLTSAVCIEGAKVEKWKLVAARLGEYNLHTDPDCIRDSNGVQCAPPPLEIEVDEQLVHEDYFIRRRNQYHNIGLFRLKEEVEFSETVRPICLPITRDERSRIYFGRRLTFVGWGKTKSQLNASVKRKLRIPVTDQEVCKSKYSEIKVNLNDGQFCAGGEEARDVCRGDSGNPLMVANFENDVVHWYAVGVVSFGHGPCGMKNWPSVYTNVSAYMPWIINKLRP